MDNSETTISYFSNGKIKETDRSCSGLKQIISFNPHKGLGS
jgi:hypothetical protein